MSKTNDHTSQFKTFVKSNNTSLDIEFVDTPTFSVNDTEKFVITKALDVKWIPKSMGWSPEIDGFSQVVDSGFEGVDESELFERTVSELEKLSEGRKIYVYTLTSTVPQQNESGDIGYKTILVRHAF